MRAAALSVSSTLPAVAAQPPASGAFGTAGGPAFGDLLQRQLSARREAEPMPMPRPTLAAPPAVPSPDGVTRPDEAAFVPPDGAGSPSAFELAAPATDAPRSDRRADHGSDAAAGATETVAADPRDSPEAAGPAGTAAPGEAPKRPPGGDGGRHGALRAVTRRSGAPVPDAAGTTTPAADVALTGPRIGRDDVGRSDDDVAAAWLAALPAAGAPPTADVASAGASIDAATAADGATGSTVAAPGRPAGAPGGMHVVGKGQANAVAAFDEAGARGADAAASDRSTTTKAADAGRPLAGAAAVERQPSEASATLRAAPAAPAAPTAIAASVAASSPAGDRRGAGAAGDALAVDGARLAAAAAALLPAGPVAAATAAAAGGGPAVARADIDAPVDGAGFAGALGASVSMFAADGVQQAELHLNPAETGPIHVRIAIDAGADGSGATQARVEFHAELQATRDAIEASLPGLAGALREQGLTLAGGGVFQGAPGRDGDGAAGQGGADRGAAGGRRSPVAVDAGLLPAGLAAAAARAARSGGVDTYA